MQICQMDIEDILDKLNTEINTVADVKAIMAVLKEIREKEAALDDIIGPVEDMYSMLARNKARWVSTCQSLADCHV